MMSFEENQIVNYRIEIEKIVAYKGIAYKKCVDNETSEYRFIADPNDRLFVEQLLGYLSDEELSTFKSDDCDYMVICTIYDENGNIAQRITEMRDMLECEANDFWIPCR